MDQTQLKDSAGAVKAWTDRSYEATRDLYTGVENNLGTLGAYTTLSEYAYVNDARARRTSVVRTGSAFAGGSGDHLDLWGYNDRDELTSVDRHAGTNPGSPGAADASLGRDYGYDPIGNRTVYTPGTDPNVAYTTNSLNQYTGAEQATSPVTGQNLAYDADGNLIEGYVTGDLDGDGVVEQDDLNILLAALNTCEGDAGYTEYANLSSATTCSSPTRETIDQQDMNVLLSLWGLDATGAIRADFTYDAENRLHA